MHNKRSCWHENIDVIIEIAAGRVFSTKRVPSWIIEQFAKTRFRKCNVTHRPRTSNGARRIRDHGPFHCSIRYALAIKRGTNGPRKMYSVSIPWRHRHVGGCVAINILFSQSCEFKLLHTSWCDKCVDFMTSCAL